MLQALVEHLVKQLAAQPEQVEVAESIQEHKCAVTIRVSQDDRGRIIGRDGQTIRALRTIVATAAAHHTMSAVVDVID